VRTNNLIVLFLAIVIGGAAAFLARGWLQNHARAANNGTGSIVVAAKALGFGVTLTDESVVEIPWAAASLPDGAFATRDDLLKEGKRLVLSPLERNEPVLRSKVTGPGQRASLSTLLEEGKRAVTVRVDDVRAVAGFILPGDFVDIVLIGEQGSGVRRESYSDILLQHVKVLAVDQLASERPEQPTVPKAVTVEVTPEQAQKLLLATNIGRLSLILRQPRDINAQSDRRVTEEDIGRGKAPEPVHVAPPPPSPPPPPIVVKPPRSRPSNTATVAIVRGMKREEYTVIRSD
jgi:pilus assembly protein CpaB